MTALSRISLLTLLVVPLLGGCGSVKTLTSQRAETAPVVDGRIEEWAGTLNRYKAGKVMLGVRNDGEYLYVAVVTRDRALVRQMTMTGAELWLDPAGGKKGVRGVRFPLGFAKYNRGRRDQMPLPMGDEAPELRERMFEQTTAEMDLLFDDGTSVRVMPAALEHVQAAATYEFGTLTYELALPLKGGSGVDLALSPDATAIGLGLLTSELDGPPRGDASAAGRAGGGRGDSGRGGGGIGGQGTRGGGGGGGRVPAGGQQQADPLKLWLQVTLAR